MDRLRDSTFGAWLLIVVGLLVAGVVAHAVGEGRPMPVPGDNSRISVVAAKSSEARDEVEKLRALAPAGIAAGIDPEALTDFADQVISVAQAGAAKRVAEGAGESDQLATTFSEIARTAGELKANVNNPVFAASLRTHLLLGIDRATSLIHNLPVPASIPAAADAPFGTTTNITPRPPAPTAPTATPLVVPQPPRSLDLSKPNPEDLTR